MPTEILAIPLSKLSESPTNPRRTFDGAKLEELAASIREKGVLQPIVVRPAGKGKYEVVAGARRFRASKLAKVDDVPAIVRELTDDQVLEIQIIENAQREDIDPFEEALGYQALLDRGVLDIDAIATKVGKSAGTVKRRLVLAKIEPKVRETLKGYGAPLAAAELIASLPNHGDQKAAADWWEPGGWGPKTMPGFRHFLDTRVMRVLAMAHFDLADKDILPQAGPCTECPFNTASPRTLFPEPEGEARCQKTSCFETKAKRFIDAKLADAKARGLVLLARSYQSSIEGALLDHQWERSTAKSAEKGIIVESYMRSDLWQEVTFRRRKENSRSSSSTSGSGEPDPSRAERLEQLRGYRAEMIARRRIFDAVVERLKTSPLEVGERTIEIERLYSNQQYRAALSIARLLRPAGTPKEYASKDPAGGKHPGLTEVEAALGIAIESYTSEAIKARRNLEHLLSRASTANLQDVILAEFVAATELEIHVPDRSDGHPPLVLTVAAQVLGIDMAAIRKQADWDTLSKKAQKERLAAEKEAATATSSS